MEPQIQRLDLNGLFDTSPLHRRQVLIVKMNNVSFTGSAGVRGPVSRLQEAGRW